MNLSKFTRSIGKIEIIPDLCKGCRFCIELCPTSALAESKETNWRGYHYPVPAEESACVACRMCERVCPEMAIYVAAEENIPYDEFLAKYAEG